MFLCISVSVSVPFCYQSDYAHVSSTNIPFLFTIDGWRGHPRPRIKFFSISLGDFIAANVEDNVFSRVCLFTYPMMIMRFFVPLKLRRNWSRKSKDLVHDTKYTEGSCHCESMIKLPHKKDLCPPNLINNYWITVLHILILVRITIHEEIIFFRLIYLHLANLAEYIGVLECILEMFSASYFAII